MTALHWAAAHGVIGLMDALREREDLNELALDTIDAMPVILLVS